MQKEKSIGRNILIVVLILVTIASVCAGLFAWAKYQTTINGTATGETAKWSFKVSDGDTSTQEIDFPMTRKDNNTSVTEGKLAPGTYGELEIGIDAAGTETALTYVIEATMQNKPTNMKFYSDAERTQELTILDNKFSKGGYMKLNEAGARTEKIYWEWPFETGTTASQIEANDKIDMQDSEKTMSMQVSVTGKQVNKNPVLADLVQVGDYVNYNAIAYDEGGNVYSYTTESTLTGSQKISTFSASDTFNSEAKAQWRVLSVDRNTGKIELMSTDPTVNGLTLLGGTGFANAEIVLDNICSVYGQGEGAIGGRSITVEDIEQYSNYNKSMYENIYSSNGTIGGYRDYTSGNFYRQTKDGQGNVNGYETNIIDASTEANGIRMIQTSYAYSARNYITNSIIYNMIFNKTNTTNVKTGYWLASRSTQLYEEHCNFDIRFVSGRGLYTYDLYHSDGSVKEREYWVLPVVSLNLNIKTTGQDENGVWQLDV